MSTPPSPGQGPAEPDSKRGEPNQQGSPQPDQPHEGEPGQEASAQAEQPHQSEPGQQAPAQPEQPHQSEPCQQAPAQPEQNSGYQHPDYPQQSYPPPNYPQQGHPQQAYPPPGYPQQGYPPPNYPQQGYPPPGYPQQGYPPPGSAQQGYPQQGYPPPGYPPAYGNYPNAGGFPAPPGDPLVAASFSGWLDRIIGVFRRSFAQLALLQILAAAVSAVFGAVAVILTPDISGLTAAVESGRLLTPQDFAAVNRVNAAADTIALIGLLGLLATLIVSAFVLAASIFVVIRDAAGQRTSAVEGLRLSTGRAFPLLGWQILVAIMIAVGLLILIIPGVYLMVVFAATLFGVVVVERAGIGRCFTLVHRRFWPTVGRIVLALVFGGIYLLISQALGSLLGGGPTSVGTPIIQSVLLIPLGVLATAVAVVTYAELRFHEQQTTTAPALAAEMSR